MPSHFKVIFQKKRENFFDQKERVDQELIGEVCRTLKCYYDENRMFPIEAILKHKQVVCIRRKMLFTEIFKFLNYAS